MDKNLVINYLQSNLGEGKHTAQGVKFCCPNGCDPAKTKFNLEINLNKNSNRYLFFHSWCCHYKGHLKNLFKKYSISDAWKTHKEMWDNSSLNEYIKIEKKELPKSIPFYLYDEVYNYLTKERNIPESFLLERKVLYCYSESEELYNNIIFPFYESGELIGFSSQDFKTKKYKNHRDLNFVPYKDLININYPILITEGIYDSLSVPNAIPMLGTKPSEELYKFSKDKKIILAIDSDISIDTKKEISDNFYYYGASVVSIFDFKNYKDLNEYRQLESKRLKEEILEAFKLLINADT